MIASHVLKSGGKQSEPILDPDAGGIMGILQGNEFDKLKITETLEFSAEDGLPLSVSCTVIVTAS